MSIDPAQQQKEFSVAYAQAVVAAAALRYQQGPAVDDDSVDFTIAARGPMGTSRSPKLDVQLKSFRGVLAGGSDSIAYRLKLKNYDDLRHEDYQTPRILLLVVVPEAVDEWVHQDETALSIRRCGYWISLRGQPATTNEHSVTVQIPRNNQFSVSALRAMMGRIGTQGWP